MRCFTERSIVLPNSKLFVFQNKMLLMNTVHVSEVRPLKHHHNQNLALFYSVSIGHSQKKVKT